MTTRPPSVVLHKSPLVSGTEGLFSGISTPKHLFAEGAEKVTSVGFNYAYLEGGSADVYGGMFAATETVAVY